ncbi:topoisomerase DNA-binding C4 zinc finger domain-containing protein [Acidovorax sp. NCPPB 4044]|uniref:topoisomerase DNA-binding C4 zinc finger domain-containing protein n=1 Tax=Acidovorax sp. NCPPB 4044 TaxID=2940490 RepID=UPI00230459C9|nr:topoisomerase DNA-binding C4 zinc finger domain-containing protein [Acidovorax sp. NCPPB 4044]MDA8519865.1 topoisomerase DNA-binding C4 zinc finger domain-containing protein [Acidovorax sp. NCPPB 4044]
MPRRKKSSPLDDVLDLLAMLPWWACVLLAAVSYPLLHRWAAPLQPSDFQTPGGAVASALLQKAIVQGLASVGQYLVPLICLMAAAGPRDFAGAVGAGAPQAQAAAAHGPAATAATAPAPARPDCPRCGAAMQLRTARKGANAGTAFWGCSTYPGCRGTRAAG